MSVDVLNQIRSHTPLVICITNDVVKAFTANGLLALGASPVMSECTEDIKDLILHADALLINIGTITPAKYAFFKEALAEANRRKVPVVLDPVGCHAGAYRLRAALSLLEEYHIDVLRGNQDEIAAIYEALCGNRETQTLSGRGVDGGIVEDCSRKVYGLARKLDRIVIATGAVDYISDGTLIYGIRNGNPVMTKVTGTGCLLGAVLAAGLGGILKNSRRIVEETGNPSYIDELAKILSYYGVAGELAVSDAGNNPGSFSSTFMNRLYHLRDEEARPLEKVQAVIVPEQLRLYFVCGTPDVKGDFLLVIERALQSGVTCFQFREKGPHALQGEAKIQMALQLKALCRKYRVPFIINDDVDLALQVQADGIHVGQDDMSAADVRALRSHNIIGVSVHSVEELKHTDTDVIQYIGVGPMYPTTSKDDAQDVCGPRRITELLGHGLTVPVVGIGGINADNAGAVVAAGADGVAVISAVASSDNIKAAVERLRAVVEQP